MNILEIIWILGTLSLSYYFYWIIKNNKEKEKEEELGSFFCYY